MPHLDRVREKITEAALDVLGPYARTKAGRVADRVVRAFRAHGWAAFTEAEMEQVEDLPRIQADDPRFRDLGS